MPSAVLVGVALDSTVGSIGSVSPNGPVMNLPVIVPSALTVAMVSPWRLERL